MVSCKFLYHLHHKISSLFVSSTFFLQHMDQFQSIGQLTLEQLGLASPATCYSVRTDSTLREAVALIQEKVGVWC